MGSFYDFRPLRRRTLLLGGGIWAALVASFAVAFIGVTAIISSGELPDGSAQRGAPQVGIATLPKARQAGSPGGRAQAAAPSPAIVASGSAFPVTLTVPTTQVTNPSTSARTLAVARPNPAPPKRAHHQAQRNRPPAPRRATHSGGNVSPSGGDTGLVAKTGSTTMAQPAAKSTGDSGSPSPVPVTPEPSPASGPPGLTKEPGGLPPGLAKKPGGPPPGLAKKPGGLPPGQLKKQG